MPRLRWMFVFAIVALFTFTVGTACFFEWRKISGLRTLKAERYAKIAEKELIVKDYREKIDFYKTKEGVAHLAREQHNLSFPGERIYVIVDISSDVSP